MCVSIVFYSIMYYLWDYYGQKLMAIIMIKERYKKVENVQFYNCIITRIAQINS